jgi:hypothetical protein
MKTYLDVHLLISKLITIGDVRVTMKDPQTLRKLIFFSEPLHEVRTPSYGYFSSTLEMASSKTTSQLHEGEA